MHLNAYSLLKFLCKGLTIDFIDSTNLQTHTILFVLILRSLKSNTHYKILISIPDHFFLWNQDQFSSGKTKISVQVLLRELVQSQKSFSFLLLFVETYTVINCKIFHREIIHRILLFIFNINSWMTSAIILFRIVHHLSILLHLKTSINILWSTLKCLGQ